jgi:hypothetical protein
MALKKHNVCAQWIPASMHVWLAGLTAVRVRSKEWSTTQTLWQNLARLKRNARSPRPKLSNLVSLEKLIW